MLSVDENNIFAVEEKTKYNDSVILHRRFGRWEQLNARTSYTLNGVWGTPGHHIYTVGENGGILQYESQVRNYDLHILTLTLC